VLIAGVAGCRAFYHASGMREYPIAGKDGIADKQGGLDPVAFKYLTS